MQSGFKSLEMPLRSQIRSQQTQTSIAPRFPCPQTAYWRISLPAAKEFLSLPIAEDKRHVELLPGAKGLSRFSFPRLSPNGKWIAYSSFESGRSELYISLFPSGAGKWQVSSNGGRDSVWRHDGKELFFTTPFDDNMMAAEISEQNGDPVIGNVRALFRIRVQSSPNPVFDVSTDGKRFLINSLLLPAAPPPVTLVVNWDSELQKK
jgi:dipeptidyl aminopeptidase/acylaminoacyl peptidase